MSNGEATHEWRIEQLEERMSRLETKIQNALYVLVVNLVGIVGILLKLLVFPGPR